MLPGPPSTDPISIARDARSLVEPGLEGACRRYAAGHTDKSTLLACGKWMFFYETFGTKGVPSSLPRFLVRAFTDEVGPGFSKYGLIEDPRSKDHLPYGMAPTKMTGLTSALGFTCASCHIARLPDGRIAIGAPNHHYDYGKHILAMTLFPFLATSGPDKHSMDAVAALQPLLDRLRAQPQIWAKLGGALMRAMGAFKIPILSPATERGYATWPLGTQDFLLAPLATDDDVEILGKIPPLFGLPREGEVKTASMIHGMYGWSGNAKTLASFMHGFIELGGGDPKKWPEQKLLPLIEYLYSLEAPRNPARASADAIAAGKALFQSKGCLGCHDGPRHSGKRVYKFDEIGTDETLARWMDSQHLGQPCCGAHLEDPLTRGVKSPRLTGLWLQRRFLHNGALASLEQLFCLAARPKTVAPLGAEGHKQTCEGLSTVEKHAIIDYLRAL